MWIIYSKSINKICIVYSNGYFDWLKNMYAKQIYLCAKRIKYIFAKQNKIYLSAERIKYISVQNK